MNNRIQTLVLAFPSLQLLVKAVQDVANTMFESNSTIDTDLNNSNDIKNIRFKPGIYDQTLTENFYILSNKELCAQSPKELTFGLSVSSPSKQRNILCQAARVFVLATRFQPLIEKKFYSICKVGKQERTDFGVDKCIGLIPVSLL